MKKALLSILALAGVAGAKPLSQRIVKLDVQGDSVIAVATAGSESGVERDMTCRVLDDDKPRGDHCVIIRVDKRTTTVKTDLGTDVVSHHGTLTVEFMRAKK